MDFWDGLLETLGWVAGSDWPEGSETGMRALAGDWRNAAEELRGIMADINAAKAAALGAYPSGEARDEIAGAFDKMRDGTGASKEQENNNLKKLAEFFDKLSESADGVGTEIEYAKWMMWSSLGLLAIELAAAWLFPPTAPAVELAAIAATRVTIRMIARQSLLAALKHVLKMAVTKGIKFLVKHVALDLALGTIQDLGIQWIQKEQGHRKDINWDQVKMTALSSGAGALGGAAAGHWLGNRLKHVDLGPGMKGAVTGLGAGFAGSIAGYAPQFAIDVMNNGWGGALSNFDPRMITAGLSNGAMSGGNKARATNFHFGRMGAPIGVGAPGGPRVGYAGLGPEGAGTHSNGGPDMRPAGSNGLSTTQNGGVGQGEHGGSGGERTGGDNVGGGSNNRANSGDGSSTRTDDTSTQNGDSSRTGDSDRTYSTDADRQQGGGSESRATDGGQQQGGSESRGTDGGQQQGGSESRGNDGGQHGGSESRGNDAGQQHGGSESRGNDGGQQHAGAPESRAGAPEQHAGADTGGADHSRAGIADGGSTHDSGTGESGSGDRSSAPQQHSGAEPGNTAVSHNSGDAGRVGDGAPVRSGADAGPARPGADGAAPRQSGDGAAPRQAGDAATSRPAGDAANSRPAGAEPGRGGETRPGAEPKAADSRAGSPEVKSGADRPRGDSRAGISDANAVRAGKDSTPGVRAESSGSEVSRAPERRAGGADEHVQVRPDSDQNVRPRSESDAPQSRSKPETGAPQADRPHAGAEPRAGDDGGRPRANDARPGGDGPNRAGDADPARRNEHADDSDSRPHHDDVQLVPVADPGATAHPRQSGADGAPRQHAADGDGTPPRQNGDSENKRPLEPDDPNRGKCGELSLNRLHEWFGDRIRLPERTIGADGMTQRELVGAAGGQLRDFAGGHDAIQRRLLKLGDGAVALVVDTYKGPRDEHGVGAHAYLLVNEGGQIKVHDPGMEADHGYPPRTPKELHSVSAIMFKPDGTPTDKVPSHIRDELLANPADLADAGRIGNLPPGQHHGFFPADEPVPPGLQRGPDGLLRQPNDPPQVYRSPDGAWHHVNDAPGTFRDKGFNLTDGKRWIKDHLSGQDLAFKAEVAEEGDYPVKDPKALADLAKASELRIKQGELRSDVNDLLKPQMDEFNVRDKDGKLDVNKLSEKNLPKEIPKIAAEIEKHARLPESDPRHLTPEQKIEKLARLYDMEENAREYNRLGKEMVATSKLLGELGATAYALDPDIHPGAVQVTPFKGAFDGNNSVDIAVFIPRDGDTPAKLVVIEAKGVGSDLGSAATPAGRAQQGTPEYLRRTLAIDENLRTILTESEADLLQRPEGQALLDIRNQLLEAHHDGTLDIEYHKVHVDINGKADYAKFKLDHDGARVPMNDIGGVISRDSLQPPTQPDASAPDAGSPDPTATGPVPHAPDNPVSHPDDRRGRCGELSLQELRAMYGEDRVNLPDRPIGPDGMTREELQLAAGGQLQPTTHADTHQRLLDLGDGAAALMVDSYAGPRDAYGVGSHAYLLVNEGGQIIVRDLGAGLPDHGYPPRVPAGMNGSHAIVFDGRGRPDHPLNAVDRARLTAEAQAQAQAGQPRVGQAYDGRPDDANPTRHDGTGEPAPRVRDDNGELPAQVPDEVGLDRPDAGPPDRGLPEVEVIGEPGPGVTPEMLDAARKSVAETGEPLVIFGSRQTGISERSGAPFHADSDLDIAATTPEGLMKLADVHEGSSPIPKVKDVAGIFTEQEARDKGYLVIKPADPGPAAPVRPADPGTSTHDRDVPDAESRPRQSAENTPVGDRAPREPEAENGTRPRPSDEMAGSGDDRAPRYESTAEWADRMRAETAEWTARMAADHAAEMRRIADIEPRDWASQMAADHAEWRARMLALRAEFSRGIADGTLPHPETEVPSAETGKHRTPEPGGEVPHEGDVKVWPPEDSTAQPEPEGAGGGKKPPESPPPVGDPGEDGTNPGDRKSGDGTPPHETDGTQHPEDPFDARQRELEAERDRVVAERDAVQQQRDQLAGRLRVSSENDWAALHPDNLAQTLEELRGRTMEVREEMPREHARIDELERLSDRVHDANNDIARIDRELAALDAAREAARLETPEGEYARLLEERRELDHEREFARAKRDELAAYLGFTDLTGSAFEHRMLELYDQAQSRRTRIPGNLDTPERIVREQLSGSERELHLRDLRRFSDAMRDCERLDTAIAEKDARLAQLRDEGVVGERPPGDDTGNTLDRLAREYADLLREVEARRPVMEDLARRLGIPLSELGPHPRDLEKALDWHRTRTMRVDNGEMAERHRALDELEAAARDVLVGEHEMGKLRDEMARLNGVWRDLVAAENGWMVTDRVGYIPGEPSRIIVFGPRADFEPSRAGHDDALAHAILTEPVVAQAMMRQPRVEYQRVVFDQDGTVRREPMNGPRVERTTTGWINGDPGLLLVRWQDADGQWHNVDPAKPSLRTNRGPDAGHEYDPGNPDWWGGLSDYINDLATPFSDIPPGHIAKNMLPLNPMNVETRYFDYGVSPDDIVSLHLGADIGSIQRNIRTLFMAIDHPLVREWIHRHPAIGDWVLARPWLKRFFPVGTMWSSFQWHRPPETNFQPMYRTWEPAEHARVEIPEWLRPAIDEDVANWRRVQEWADGEYDRFRADDQLADRMAERLAEYRQEQMRVGAQDLVERIRKELVDPHRGIEPDQAGVDREVQRINEAINRIADDSFDNFATDDRVAIRHTIADIRQQLLDIRNERAITDADITRIVDGLAPDIRPLPPKIEEHNWPDPFPDRPQPDSAPPKHEFPAFTRDEIQQILNHLMVDEHPAVDYADPDGNVTTRRMDQLADVAEAINRIVDGKPLPADVVLMLDALAESNFLRTPAPRDGRWTWHDANAHAVAEGFHWDANRPPLTGDRANIPYAPEPLHAPEPFLPRDRYEQQLANAKELWDTRSRALLEAARVAGVDPESLFRAADPADRLANLRTQQPDAEGRQRIDDLSVALRDFDAATAEVMRLEQRLEQHDVNLDRARAAIRGGQPEVPVLEADSNPRQQEPAPTAEELLQQQRIAEADARQRSNEIERLEQAKADAIRARDEAADELRRAQDQAEAEDAFERHRFAERDVAERDQQLADQIRKNTMLEAGAEPLDGVPQIGIVPGDPPQVIVVVRGEATDPTTLIDRATAVHPELDDLVGPNRDNVTTYRLVPGEGGRTQVHRTDSPEVLARSAEALAEQQRIAEADARQRGNEIERLEQAKADAVRARDEAARQLDEAQDQGEAEQAYEQRNFAERVLAERDQQLAEQLRKNTMLEAGAEPLDGVPQIGIIPGDPPQAIVVVRGEATDPTTLIDRATAVHPELGDLVGPNRDNVVVYRLVPGEDGRTEVRRTDPPDAPPLAVPRPEPDAPSDGGGAKKPPTGETPAPAQPQTTPATNDAAAQSKPNENPAAVTNKPANTSNDVVDQAAPLRETPRPTEDGAANKPVVEASKPVAEASKPVAEASKPVVEANKPVAEPDQPMSAAEELAQQQRFAEADARQRSNEIERLEQAKADAIRARDEAAEELRQAQDPAAAEEAFERHRYAERDVAERDQQLADQIRKDTMLEAGAEPLDGVPQIGIIPGDPPQAIVVVRGEATDPTTLIDRAVAQHPELGDLVGPNRDNVTTYRLVPGEDGRTQVHRTDSPEVLARSAEALAEQQRIAEADARQRGNEIERLEQ
ncbi:hypothetical protein ACFQ9K_35020, partial [Nocardia sp. NPDC056564]